MDIQYTSCLLAMNNEQTNIAIAVYNSYCVVCMEQAVCIIKVVFNSVRAYADMMCVLLLVI